MFTLSRAHLETKRELPNADPTSTALAVLVLPLSVVAPNDSNNPPITGLHSKKKHHHSTCLVAGKLF